MVSPDVESPAEDADLPAPRPKRRWRWLKRAALTSCASLVAFVVFIVIGLVPINNDFVPVADDAPGVDIYLTSNAVHADVIVPLRTPGTGDQPAVDWTKLFPRKHFTGDISTATHVAIGWGDKGFYIDTPTWADVKLSTALQAMFLPSATCVHTACVRPERLLVKRRVRISHAQYAELVAFIRETLRMTEQGESIVIADAHYHSGDAFYEAMGSYWFCYTCNSWVGQAMRRAGIKTPMMTPLPHSMYLYLPPEKPEVDALR